MSSRLQRKGPSAERERDEVELMRMQQSVEGCFPARAAQELVVAIFRSQVGLAIDLARGVRPSHRDEPNTTEKATHSAAMWASELLDVPANEIDRRIYDAVIEVAGEPAKR